MNLTGPQQKKIECFLLHYIKIVKYDSLKAISGTLHLYYLLGIFQRATQVK